MESFKRTVLALAVATAAFAVHAERRLGFGIDAYNVSFPIQDPKNQLFSPLAFELDCCVMADALDPIGRANVAEALSLHSDFDNVYTPILDALEKAPETNQLYFSSARAIAVTEPEKVNVEYRKRLLDSRFNGAIGRLWPTSGIENWMKAKLDGKIDDWLIPLPKVGYAEYCVIDASVVEMHLPSDIVAVEETLSFKKIDGTSVKTPFVRFNINAQYARTPSYTSVRIPMKGGAFFYAFMPSPPHTVADVRRSITPETIAKIINEPLDPGVQDNGTAYCEIHLPRFALDGKCSLEKAFTISKVPVTDITYFYKQLKHRTSWQCTRFNFKLPHLAPATTPPEPEAIRNRALFIRPFFFFIYVPEIDAIPVIGQYMGE